MPRRPGRPRKATENGHDSGQAREPVVKVPARARRNGAGDSAGVQPTPSLPSSAVVTVSPALLSLDDAGRYLGISAWTVRDFIEAGLLTPVPVPAPSGKRLRRVVVAREDLDALVRSWRGRP